LVRISVLYVLALNSFTLGVYVDRIYVIELEIKDATDTARSASIPGPKPRQRWPVDDETLRQNIIFPL
jgi:hypothetical protein